MKKLIILLMSLTVFCGSAAARMPEREFNDSDGLFTMVEAKLPTAVMNYGYLGLDVVAGWRFCPQFALGVGARKLYISSHSAVESVAFYLAMGCREAEELEPMHVAKEPYDRQLEYVLK